MWLRYGAYILLVYGASCATLSSDDETSQWVQSQENKTKVTEPEQEKIDLSPTDIQTTIDCLLDDGTRGQCVQYFQCDGNKHIIEDGTTLIDFRGKRKCLSYLEVCCGLKPIVEDEVNTEAPAPKRTNTTSEVTIADEILRQDVSIDDECGWNNVRTYIFPNKTKDQQIYANYGEYRWMIALIKKRKNVNVWVSDDYIGGGSLIHPSVVLTAAHKLHNIKPRELKCRGGEWDTQTELEKYKFQERDARKIMIHPDFFRASLYYDAALIFLKKPFDLQSAPHMGLACLNKVMPEPDTECFTMGWGRLFNEKNKYAVVLKKIVGRSVGTSLRWLKGGNQTCNRISVALVLMQNAALSSATQHAMPQPKAETKLSLVNSQACETMLQATRLGPYFRIHSSLTCAGGQEGVDACDKDGGSSLVCPINKNGENVRYAMVGMVAYGIGCGVKDRPGVYVNVPAIYPWVDKAMTDEKYGTVTYTV